MYAALLPGKRLHAAERGASHFVKANQKKGRDRRLIPALC